MNLTYPLLHRRISGWIIPANIQSKINKSILKYSDFTQSAIALEKQYLESTSTLPSSIKNVENDLHKVLQQYAVLSNTINDSTHASTLAEIARIEKQTEGLKHKILKAEKQKFDEQLQKIIKIKEQLFPNNGLQERNQSGIQYYLQYGKSFVDKLIDSIEFNNKEVIVFLED
ncbi:MAG: bacillithiol biosynthesis BshC [Saprospiraceae bacterium]|nr:bacillithiol biosynthesis BshC [Candidatus Defluviibacterium haderslevense]